MRDLSKLLVGGIAGFLALSMPLLADSSVELLRDDIAKAQRASVKKIFGEDLEITDKPKNHKNWGEWIIAENGLDTSKWKATKIKGTDMWGIAPIVDGKNDCGAVLWICQHNKHIVFNAEKLKNSGVCGDLRESYKAQDGTYKKVIVPFTF